MSRIFWMKQFLRERGYSLEHTHADNQEWLERAIEIETAREREAADWREIFESVLAESDPAEDEKFLEFLLN